MAKSDLPPLLMTVERGPKLSPATAADAERLETYRRGSEVNVVFVRNGSRVMEKKWWAVLNRAIKDCGTPWKNSQQASEAIKLSLGIVNLGKTVGGAWFHWPKSLTELDDAELDEAVRDMMGLLYEITGVDPAEWSKESADVGRDRTESSALPPEADEGSGDASSPITNPAPDNSARGGPEEGGASEEAPPSTTLTDDDRARLKAYAKRLIVVIGGDARWLLEESGRLVIEESVPEGIARDKARTAAKYAVRACTDYVGKEPAMERSDAIEMIAGIIGADPKEIKP